MSTKPQQHPPRWTYSEFVRLPDDGNRYEIIAGELYMTPAPSTRHQLAITPLLAVLHSFVENHNLGWVLPGPVDVLFAEGDYLEPDLVFIRLSRKNIISDRGIEGAPDLVVEILSPSTAMIDRGIKRDRYEHFGVTEYWIVDLDQKLIAVNRFGEQGHQSHVVTESIDWTPIPGGPSLTINLANVFRGFS
ncbi:MAG TPA: Uma2 family endonuclease [Longimicrobiaceae bacterium]|nr:Uma2 family endonuclease [Longimicrobiaceae bacterium]